MPVSNRKSIWAQLTVDELGTLIEECGSKAEILRRLTLATARNNYATLEAKAAEWGLELPAPWGCRIASGS